MSRLLDLPPYVERDDALFLREATELTEWHRAGCSAYAKIIADTSSFACVEEIPFLHVGLFKRLDLRTQGPGVEHSRMLLSSTTSGGAPSRIALDRRSSELQARSSLAILTELIGTERRPLLVLDDAASLRRRGEIGARSAAAFSLLPLASETHFLLEDAANSASLKIDALKRVASQHSRLIVYGFTSLLWTAWGSREFPAELRRLLAGKEIHFVHSGGWKKLESLRIERRQFDEALLKGLAPASRVIDFYGLVEQVGIVFPLCERGFRHVPRWADVIVRDPWTSTPLSDSIGQLQLLNLLAWGAPYHSVLTEDLGRLVAGDCPCGRRGRRFLFDERMPQAELRGCANV